MLVTVTLVVQWVLLMIIPLKNCLVNAFKCRTPELLRQKRCPWYYFQMRAVQFGYLNKASFFLQAVFGLQRPTFQKRASFQSTTAEV